jgi:hypothetical protein
MTQRIKPKPRKETQMSDSLTQGQYDALHNPKLPEFECMECGGKESSPSAPHVHQYPKSVSRRWLRRQAQAAAAAATAAEALRNRTSPCPLCNVEIRAGVWHACAPSRPKTAEEQGAATAARMNAEAMAASLRAAGYKVERSDDETGKD